jgi:lysine-N-methylase
MADEAKTGRPSYAANFVCIGPQCEDSCCVGWDIPLDRATYERYQKFAPHRLGKRVEQVVQIAAAGSPQEQYATIRTIKGNCGFLDADKLCGVQKEYGGELLPATCSIYPRVLNEVEGVHEGSLMMSCPEAARNILLAPGSTRIEGDLAGASFRKDICYQLGVNGDGLLYKPFSHYTAIRACLVDIMQDRSRTLWQRLLIVGSLCKRLSEITSPQQAEIIPAILADFRQIIGTDWGNSEMLKIPSHPEARLKVILRITELLSRELTCGPRFFDTYWNFIEGIGSAPGSGSDSANDILRFQHAERTYFDPFFARFPHILENYLLNFMYQTLFPFGREGSPNFVRRSIFEEYILMTTQFGWITGLLIGIASCHKESFCEEHVVKTIQSIAREVEHAPAVLTAISNYMTSYNLDNIPGMGLLLKP